MTSGPALIETDVLVLGSGIAGLSYAIKAAQHGRVTVLTKKEDSEGNTNYAQGGIAAVMDPGDSFDAHIADTLEAGAGLCDREAVELLVRSGPERVRELIEYGVRFTYERDRPGRLSLAREGGHSARRIVRADDLTGRAIERGLLDAAARAGVAIHEHYFALDLWVSEGDGGRRCAGALAVDRETGEQVAVAARVTFLATGGCGQVYRYTTNPRIATGDGIAMAFRAGAPVANLEFVQFHPTALHPVEPRAFLISEAVRGEGAVLRDDTGRAFMAEYHGLADLAPRDVVARAIDAEMRSTGARHVWLDCSPIPADHFAERFPNILETCRSRGLDPPGDPLPVVPAAHYMCGGVRTDLAARTGVEGLLAAGEVACTGVHGANRLASNSLLEAVVFAARAAETTARLLEAPASSPRAAPRARSAETPTPGLEELRREIRRVLWAGAGIVRDDEGLAAAGRALANLSARVSREPSSADAAEVANLHLLGELIVRSAILRRESRGLHFSRSHPDTDPAFQRDTIIQPDHGKEHST
ncbi:MAG TPA: L-aspartate oxidase [Gemmatimonadota bacterium]|nr:L-aspartate oxidase [Gemmatimonadota bacterium]